MKLFFVTGAPKSGTTWLQRILNAHPQIACFGEGHFIEQIALPVQEMLRRYNLKLDLVADRVYGGQPDYPLLDGADAASLIRGAITQLMRRANPPPGTVFLGDKTPGYSRHLDMLDTIFPDCLLIDIIRDPRDVVVSSIYHSQRAGAEIGRAEMIAHALKLWTAHIRHIERAAPRLGARLLQVRYDALVNAPLAEMRRLFAHFDGAATDDATLAAIAARTSFTALSGGRQPGHADNDSFFRSGTTGQYRSELTPAEQTGLTAHLAPLLARYDFPA